MYLKASSVRCFRAIIINFLLCVCLFPCVSGVMRVCVLFFYVRALVFYYLLYFTATLQYLSFLCSLLPLQILVWPLPRAFLFPSMAVLCSAWCRVSTSQLARFPNLFLTSFHTWFPASTSVSTSVSSSLVFHARLPCYACVAHRGRVPTPRLASVLRRAGSSFSFSSPRSIRS